MRTLRKDTATQKMFFEWMLSLKDNPSQIPARHRDESSDVAKTRLSYTELRSDVVAVTGKKGLHISHWVVRPQEYPGFIMSMAKVRERIAAHQALLIKQNLSPRYQKTRKFLEVPTIAAQALDILLNQGMCPQDHGLNSEQPNLIQRGIPGKTKTEEWITSFRQPPWRIERREDGLFARLHRGEGHQQLTHVNIIVFNNYRIVVGCSLNFACKEGKCDDRAGRTVAFVWEPGEQKLKFWAFASVTLIWDKEPTATIPVATGCPIYVLSEEEKDAITRLAIVFEDEVYHSLKEVFAKTQAWQDLPDHLVTSQLGLDIVARSEWQESKKREVPQVLAKPLADAQGKSNFSPLAKVYSSLAFIFLPGGWGTLDLFYEDLELYTIVDTTEEALEVIDRFYGSIP
jgi:hypothetical protein